MRIEVKDESEELREMGMMRRGRSRRKKCKGKNSNAGERDKKLGKIRKNGKEKRVKEFKEEGKFRKREKKKKKKLKLILPLEKILFLIERKPGIQKNIKVHLS